MPHSGDFLYAGIICIKLQLKDGAIVMFDKACVAFKHLFERMARGAFLVNQITPTD